MVAALVVSAGAELLLLRIGIRLGPALKGAAAYEMAYPILLFVGVVAFNLALIFATAFLIATGWVAGRRSVWWACLPVGVLVSIVALQVAGPSAGTVAFFALAVGTAAVWGLTQATLEVLRMESAADQSSSLSRQVITLLSRRALPSLLVLLAFSMTTTVYYHLAWASSLAGMAVPGAIAALTAGEIAIVAAGIISPVALRVRPAIVPVALASVSTVLVAGFALSTPLLPLVATWSIGLSMFLPLAVYLAAAWCVTLSLFSAAMRCASRREAAVLLLAIAAGRTWAASYNGMLAASAGTAATGPARHGGAGGRTVPESGGDRAAERPVGS